jgi:hypothetical protein
LQRSHECVSAQRRAPAFRAQQSAANKSDENVATALEASEKNWKLENARAGEKMFRYERVREMATKEQRYKAEKLFCVNGSPRTSDGLQISVIKSYTGHK